MARTPINADHPVCTIRNSSFGGPATIGCPMCRKVKFRITVGCVECVAYVARDYLFHMITEHSMELARDIDDILSTTIREFIAGNN